MGIFVVVIHSYFTFELLELPCPFSLRLVVRRIRHVNDPVCPRACFPVVNFPSLVPFFWNGRGYIRQIQSFPVALTVVARLPLSKLPTPPHSFPHVCRLCFCRD